ncbi:MAG: DNA polymerase IV [Candidatus Omnitrophica bacterium]|nr:DNA polymerase IV [Candidatus Omnitrophota bacterium]
MKKIIGHLDMDAFFASVEQRDNPSLKGRPVIVGADPKGGKGRGVVSTCSYEARKYGIHSAMPISMAYRLCPEGIFLKGHAQKYKEASRAVFKILYDFTPDIQPVSIDEAYFDLTHSCHLFGTPLDAAVQIKSRIRRELNLVASVGIAPNKMLAKIASDYNKPDGLTEVTEEDMFDFLWPLPVEKLGGVGPQTQAALKQMGIISIEDLAQTPCHMLEERFGEHGAHLYQLAHGADQREVKADDTIKSVSHEHTYLEDTNNTEAVERTLSYLCEKIVRRLWKYHLKGRTVTLKVRLSNFKTFSRSVTLADRVCFYDDLYRTSLNLFRSCMRPQMRIRLIGVRVSQFEDLYVQDNLFDAVDRQKIKLHTIHEVVDKIKDKFGDHAIHRAGSLKKRSS